MVWLFQVIDGHVDTFWDIGKIYRPFSSRSATGHVDLHRLKEGNVLACMFAVYPANEQAELIYNLDRWIALVNDQENGLVHVKDIDDLDRAKSETRIGAILHVEGSGWIDSEFHLLHLAKHLGLRCLGITHNISNRFGTAVMDGRNAGLTEEGKALVWEAQAKGITIDVSHLNDRSFWDVIEITRLPVIASHSNARAICGHKRNLTDEQIKAIGDTGGTIGINFGISFLDPAQNKENIDLGFDVIKKHVDRIVDLASIDSVSIGSDFDGTRVPACIKDASIFPQFFNYLNENGYSGQDLEKIARDNFLRVFKATW